MAEEESALVSFSLENRDVPRANRRFLGRAVRFAADQGVRQFVDLGTGLPSQGHVHEVVGEIDPGAHVVYVDNDPVVVAHGRTRPTRPVSCAPSATGCRRAAT